MGVDAQTRCRIGDVPDGDARGFTLIDGAGQTRSVIVVRLGDEARVYENRCPHRGTPLDWRPDRFLDSTGEHLICATHGATFRLEDGLCLSGPCLGDALTAVPSRLEDGEISLD